MGVYLNKIDGKYIPVQGKTQAIKEQLGESVLVMPCAPKSLDSLLSHELLLCVVHNVDFDAAALVCSADDLTTFTNPVDIRPKDWVIVNKHAAQQRTDLDFKHAAALGYEG